RRHELPKAAAYSIRRSEMIGSTRRSTVDERQIDTAKARNQLPGRLTAQTSWRAAAPTSASPGVHDHKEWPDTAVEATRPAPACPLPHVRGHSPCLPCAPAR